MNDKKLYLTLLYSSLTFLTACGGSGGGGAALAGIEGSGGEVFLAAPAVQFVVTDVNGDGLEDIVAAANLDVNGAVVEFLRDPADPALFRPSIRYPVECKLAAIAVADLNADGLTDVVVSCAKESGFRLLQQSTSGGGRLLPSRFTQMPGTVQALAIADIDGDGLPDVVASISDGTSVRTLAFATQQTAEPGTFNAAVTVGEGSPRMFAVDLNDDGLMDLLTAIVFSGGPGHNATARVLEYLQDPAVPGTFQQTVVPSAALPISLHSVGVALSVGAPPLALCGVSADIRSQTWQAWWRVPGVGSGSGASRAICWQILVEDVDGDGRDDVILSYGSGAVVLANTALLGGVLGVDVLLQTTPGGFVHHEYAMPPLHGHIVVADLNHDGLRDLAFTANGQLFYFPQDPAAPGTFGAAVTIGSP